MLEQKLYKAQEELMEFHRKKGEVRFRHGVLLVNLYCIMFITFVAVLARNIT